MPIRKGLVWRMSMGHFISIIYTLYQVYESGVIEDVEMGMEMW